MSNPFNDPVIEEFRANAGRVGGWFDGARLLLLTTTGARSGAPHTVPLGYLPDADGRVVVIGSAGGGPRHPAWFHNLLAHPRATVETGVFTYDVNAVVLTGAERDAVFARAVEADRGWADYEEKSGRTLPVVVLENVSVGPGSIAADGPGAALVAVHDAFRRELGLIRAEIAAGTTLGAQLRITCLSLCAGLSNHHAGEDVAMFPFLSHRFPELDDVLARLRVEHERVSALLTELRTAVGDTTAGPADVLARVDRLTAELEAHLRYEEEQLVPILELR